MRITEILIGGLLGFCISSYASLMPSVSLTMNPKFNHHHVPPSVLNPPGGPSIIFTGVTADESMSGSYSSSPLLELKENQNFRIEFKLPENYQIRVLQPYDEYFARIYLSTTAESLLFESATYQLEYLNTVTMEKVTFAAYIQDTELTGNSFSVSSTEAIPDYFIFDAITLEGSTPADGVGSSFVLTEAQLHVRWTIRDSAADAGPIIEVVHIPEPDIAVFFTAVSAFFLMHTLNNRRYARG